MNVKPLGDRVVIRRHEEESRTAGGVILPDSAKRKPQKGTILAVGPGPMMKDGTRRALQVKKGDVVLFTNWAGDEYKSGSEDDILLMREEDILAVLDE